MKLNLFELLNKRNKIEMKILEKIKNFLEDIIFSDKTCFSSLVSKEACNLFLLISPLIFQTNRLIIFLKDLLVSQQTETPSSSSSSNKKNLLLLFSRHLCKWENFSKYFSLNLISEEYFCQFFDQLLLFTGSKIQSNSLPPEISNFFHHLLQYFYSIKNNQNFIDKYFVPIIKKIDSLANFFHKNDRFDKKQFESFSISFLRNFGLFISCLKRKDEFSSANQTKLSSYIFSLIEKFNILESKLSDQFNFKEKTLSNKKNLNFPSENWSCTRNNYFFITLSTNINCVERSSLIDTKIKSLDKVFLLKKFPVDPILCFGKIHSKMQLPKWQNNCVTKITIFFNF